MITTTEPAVRLNWPEPYNEVPKDVFHREDVYQLELERIFYGPEWHPLVHRAEVPAPGTFKTGYLGEAPILCIHGDDGKIRIFENACPHRATQLKTASRGSLERLECPYHRWTFSRDGGLLGAPGINDFSPAFCKEDFGLREIRSAEHAGLVFATCDAAAPPLDEYLGDAAPFLARALGGDGRLNLIGYQKVLFSSNWKAYADNDGYHGPLLHAAFRHLKWSSASGERFVTVHNHKVADSRLANVPNEGFLKDHSLVEGRDPQRPPGNLVVNLFPLNLITFNLDVINVRYAMPKSAGETEVHYAYFSHADDTAELARHRVRQASNLIGPSGLISLEDGAVFNRIHVGSHSPGNVSFQKGYKGPIAPPSSFDRSDESGNLIRWEHYRRVMGFDRD